MITLVLIGCCGLFTCYYYFIASRLCKLYLVMLFSVIAGSIFRWWCLKSWINSGEHTDTSVVKENIPSLLFFYLIWKSWINILKNRAIVTFKKISLKALYSTQNIMMCGTQNHLPVILGILSRFKKWHIIIRQNTLSAKPH